MSGFVVFRCLLVPNLAGLCLPPEPKQPATEKAGPEHTELTGPTKPMNPPGLAPTWPMEPTKPVSPTVPAEPKTESAPVLPHAVTPPKNAGEGKWMGNWKDESRWKKSLPKRPIVPGSV